MSDIRIAIFLLIPLVYAHSLADGTDDEKRTKKQAQAVSKEVYDKIMRVQDAIDYLASVGISPDDIEPNNLPFSSESFQDCAAQAEETLSTKDDLAIASVSCLKRHAADWSSEKVE